MTGWATDLGALVPDEVRLELIERYRGQAFDHAADVLAIMERADPEESRISVWSADAMAELRRVYRRRADHLAQLAPETLHTPTLPRDVRALSDALDAADDQPVRVWHITLIDGTSFIVFELERERRIAGCARSMNQRIVRKLEGRIDRGDGKL